MQSVPLVTDTDSVIGEPFGPSIDGLLKARWLPWRPNRAGAGFGTVALAWLSLPYITTYRQGLLTSSPWRTTWAINRSWYSAIFHRRNQQPPPLTRQ